MQTPH
jgi:anaerobic selenocysteine-containing dehydrogenase